MKENLLRVLVLEDSDLDYLLLKTYLSASRLPLLSIERVENVQEYERFVSAHRIDVALVDLFLDQSEGLETLQSVIDINNDIPIVVISSAEELALKAVSSGAQDYLVKASLDSCMLEKSIKYAIERKRHQINYQILFDNNPAPMWAFDPHTLRIKMVNKCAVRVYGYTESEFLNLSLIDLRPPSDHPAFLNNVANLLQSGHNGSVEQVQRHRKKDGSFIYVEINTQSIMQGGTELYIAVMKDVTEKKEQLELLAKRERQLALAIGAGRMFTLDIDLIAGEFSVSQNAAELLGVETKERNKLSDILLLVHPEDRKKVEDTINECDGTEKSNIQFRLIRPDNGKVQWFERRGYPHVDNNGKVIGSNGLLIDITALKQAESDLLVSYQQLELATKQQADILNALPAHVALLNNDGDIVTVNDAWKAYLNNRKAKRNSHTITENLFATGANRLLPDEIQTGIKNVLNGKIRQFTKEYKEQTPHDTVWLKLIAAPLNSGNEVGAVIMKIDITDRKKIEESLCRAQANLLAIFENTDDSFILIDPDYRLIAFNRKARETSRAIAGREYQLNEPLLDYVHCSAYHEFAKKLSDVKKRGSCEFELQLESDGGTKWYQTKIKAIYSFENVLIGFSISMHNYTDLKLAEKNLRESEEHFRTLIENSGDMFMITDGNGKISYISPSTIRILGFSEHELRDVNGVNMIHSDDIMNYQTLLLDVKSNPGKLYQHKRRVRDANNNWLWIEGTIVNLTHLPAINGIVENFRDISQRIEIEAALERSKYFLQKANKVAKIGYWVADIKADWKITWSSETYPIYNLRRGEFNGTIEGFMELLSIHDQNQVRNALQLSQETLAPLEITHSLITSHGDVRWIHIAAEYTFDDNGTPLLLIGVVKDITDKKVYEDNLRKSKANLAALINNTNDMVWAIDKDLMITAANAACKNIVYQIFRKEVKEGDSVLAGYPANDVKEWNDIYNSVLKGQPLLFERAFNLFEHKIIYLEISLNPIYDGKEIAGVSCFSRNVTERKLIENEMRIVNDRYKLLAKATNDAIYDFDLLTETVSWNHGLSTLFGYEASGDQSNAQWWKNNVHSLDLEHVEQNLNRALANGEQNLVANYRFKCRDGSFKYVFDRSHVTYRNGVPVRMIGAIQDIHELTEYRMSLEQKVDERTKKLNEALKKEKELVDMKNRFVSIASHEFRTPLSTIDFATGFLESYRHRISDQEVSAKLKNIEAQVRHMTALLDDVLTVGKTGSGTIKIQKQFIDLNILLNDIISDVKRSTMCKHNILLTTDANVSGFETDEKVIKNIITNLLTNAIKFSPGKENIFIGCSQQKSAFTLKVKDEGIGIRPEDMNVIFEPFNRGSNVGTISGTGLGLTIVKKGVELLNGELTFKTSTAGTEFSVCLPYN